MRARVALSLALPSLFLVLTAPPAEAQTIASPYEFIDTRHEVSFHVGQAGASRGVADLGPGGGTMFGGRYGIELGGPFALEGNVFFLPTDRQVYNPNTEESLPELRGSTSALVAGFDGRLRFTLTGARTWNRLAPFVTVGGGVVGDIRSGPSSLETDQEPEIHPDDRGDFGPSFMGVLSAGTRWLPDDRITVRLEAGLNLWRVGTPQAFFDFEDELTGLQEIEWTNASLISIGVGYRF